MPFLSDYWEYHRCYEIPRNYALWAGMGLLSAVVHKKVLYTHGDIEIHGPMYIGLIGVQGSSKSTCCHFAKNFYQSVFPDGNVGPSRTSPEKLANIMNGEKFPRVFTNWNNEQVEVRPYALFINEFKNFVGRSPFDMITMLTDMYDVKSYDASTIARDVELIINPAMTILMCETPEWFMSNIKADIITGGIGRRFILVYETEDPEPVSIPTITESARAAESRIKDRLLRMRSFTAKYSWAPGMLPLYDKWYRDLHHRRIKESNRMMRGYLKSKHIQGFKTMMMLDASSDKPMGLFSKELFEEMDHMLAAIEPNMPKLSAGSGRNELKFVYQKALDLLEAGWMDEKGWMPRKQLMRELETEVSPMETNYIINHLKETDQIVERMVEFPTGQIQNGQPILVRRTMIILPWKLKEEQTKPSLPAPPSESAGPQT